MNIIAVKDIVTIDQYYKRENQSRGAGAKVIG